MAFAPHAVFASKPSAGPSNGQQIDRGGGSSVNPKGYGVHDLRVYVQTGATFARPARDTYLCLLEYPDVIEGYCE